MTQTRYLPLSWSDEICPTPQPDPAAFAHRQPDGSWTLAPVREEHDEDEWDHLKAPLAPGDIVRLQENRLYPDTELIVHADGTWTTAVPVPDECNCYLLDCDPESLAHTIDDLIKYAGNAFMREPLEGTASMAREYMSLSASARRIAAGISTAPSISPFRGTEHDPPSPHPAQPQEGLAQAGRHRRRGAGEQMGNPFRVGDRRFWRRLRPVHCRGQLGLWQPPADVLAAIEIPGYMEEVR